MPKEHNLQTIGLKLGLPNSANNGIDIKAGIIDSNPNSSQNYHHKIYDYNDKNKGIATLQNLNFCIDCSSLESYFATSTNSIPNETNEKSFDNNTKNINANPFSYQDSAIKAQETINDDGTSTLTIESKQDIFAYQGKTADLLMSGISGIFASMAELAKKYGIDKAIEKAGGAKIRFWVNAAFKTESASISLAYNYGNNGGDMTRAVVSVGIELIIGEFILGATVALLGLTSAPALIATAAISAVLAGILLNTNAGKFAVDWVTDNIRFFIDFTESKLQAFFTKFDSNPNAYELVENPTLTKQDYQSIIEVLLRKDSNANDIDKTLHSFKNYLKQDKNNSSKQSNNASPTKPTSQAKSQPTPTTHTTPTNPLHIILYLEDAITPLNDIKIKLTPNHIKDSTKPQDTIQEQVSKNGKVTFTIPSNSNTFDLEIIDDRFCHKSKSNIQRVTNSYYKSNNTINLYLLAKIWLYFNGKQIFIMRGNKIVETFRAYSGNALNLAQKQNLINERGYTQFVSYVNVEDSNKIMYFCLDKHWQTQKDKGSMVEGNYYVNISDIRDRWTIWTENKFGTNTRIYTDESCTNTTESTTQRSDFYLHGGDKYGNAGGIDLAKGDSSFFKRLETLKEQFISSAAEYKDKPIIIKLVVDYSELGIEIDYIDLSRELQTKSQNPQIDTKKHKVILTANYIKPKSMSNEVFNAQKPQTYWAYKEIKKDEEFDFDNAVNMSDITHFTSGGTQKYIGESVEIDLVKFGWEDCLKQIIVFAYLQTDVNRQNSTLVINNPKWRIITWHNPIVNPRVTIYSFSGKNNDMSNGMFGKIKNRISKVHKALDFFAKVGTNIYAPLDCEVAKVDKKQVTTYGKYITLKVTGQSLEILKIRKKAINYQLRYKNEGEMKQDDKFDEDSKQYYLFYAHLSQIDKDIKQGAKVLAGQIIGKSGVTGNAKGTSAPHLHFEIRSNEYTVPKELTYLVNPAFYIEFKKLISEFSQEEKDEQQKICRQNNADKTQCKSTK
ncbi:M23 family metallopeptidase [Helicobacter sp. T3_23-1056]